MSHQKYIVGGYLTRDPEIKETPAGHSICEFGVAVDSGWGDNKKTCFWEVSMWGKQGESLRSYFNKGDGIELEGEIVLDQWTDKEGGKRSKHKFSAQKWSFPVRGPDTGDKKLTGTSSPEKKTEDHSGPKPSAWQTQEQIDDDSIPF